MIFIYKFIDEVHDYQSFIRDNINMLGDLSIIKEQFKIDNYIIDILAYDNTKHRLVIIELKNIRAKVQIIGQTLGYYSKLTNININDLYIEDVPEVMLVVPDFDKAIIHTLSYLPISYRLFKMNIDDKTIICEEYTKFYSKEQDYTNMIDITPNLVPSIEVETSEIWNMEKYNECIDKQQLYLVKEYINYLQSKYDYQLKIFYSKDRIKILDKKVISTISLSRKWFDTALTFNILQSVFPLTTVDLQYDANVLSFTIGKKSTKIRCRALPLVFKGD